MSTTVDQRSSWRGARRVRRDRGWLALLGSLALAGCGGHGDAAAKKGGWRAQVKSLHMSIIALPESADHVVGPEPLERYMARATGLPAHVSQVSDMYTSSIQALASGQVDVAMLAGGGYVNVRDQVGDLVTPLLVLLGAQGERGYYSALVVRADKPYRRLADLKGRSLAVVDLNSTSGYLMPMRAMRQQGINPDTFFSRIGVAGGHPQAVSAVYNGQYDAAWTYASNGTPQTGFVLTTWGRMEGVGMIPHGSIRDIWDVGPVPNSSFAMRTDRPQALQDLVRGALAAIPYDAPETLTMTKSLPGTSLVAGADAMFADAAKLRKEAIASERTGVATARSAHP